MEKWLLLENRIELNSLRWLEFMMFIERNCDEIQNVVLEIFKFKKKSVPIRKKSTNEETNEKIEEKM